MSFKWGPLPDTCSHIVQVNSRVFNFCSIPAAAGCGFVLRRRLVTKTHNSSIMVGNKADCEPPIPLEAPATSLTSPVVPNTIHSLDSVHPAPAETSNQLSVHDDDRTLPLNWSESRKRLVVVIISGMSFIVYATTLFLLSLAPSICLPLFYNLFSKTQPSLLI